MKILAWLVNLIGGRKMDIKWDASIVLNAINDVDWTIIVRTWSLIAEGKLSPNEAVYYVLLAHQRNAVLAAVDIDAAKFDEVCVAMAKNIG